MGGVGAIQLRMFWNARSTLVASRAEVSMKERPFSPNIRQPCVSLAARRSNLLANLVASSVGTALKWR